jgi:hypothetical protein
MEIHRWHSLVWASWRGGGVRGVEEDSAQALIASGYAWGVGLILSKQVSTCLLALLPALLPLSPSISLSTIFLAGCEALSQ